MKTILTNTNYYPGILQFFGYMLVQNLTAQYKKYYSAANGNFSVMRWWTWAYSASPRRDSTS